MPLPISPDLPNAKVIVIMSGGFSLAYHGVIRHFEKRSGLVATTLSGSSQGSSSKTIRSQLESGVEADVVILSAEGLDQLVAAGLVIAASKAELASVLLGAAIRRGGPKPAIGDVAELKAALLDAREIGIPGSTSGLFVQEELLPKLGLAGDVSCTVFDRGTESTAALAAGEVDLAIGPVSELVEQPGIEVVGPLPQDVQFAQVFAAAVVSASHRAASAKTLIDFLASDLAIQAIEKAGMLPVRGLSTRSRRSAH